MYEPPAPRSGNGDGIRMIDADDDDDSDASRPDRKSKKDKKSKKEKKKKKKFMLRNDPPSDDDRDRRKAANGASAPAGGGNIMDFYGVKQTDFKSTAKSNHNLSSGFGGGEANGYDEGDEDVVMSGDQLQEEADG